MIFWKGKACNGSAGLASDLKIVLNLPPMFEFIRALPSTAKLSETRLKPLGYPSCGSGTLAQGIPATFEQSKWKIWHQRASVVKSKMLTFSEGTHAPPLNLGSI